MDSVLTAGMSIILAVILGALGFLMLTRPSIFKNERVNWFPGLLTDEPAFDLRIVAIAFVIGSGVLVVIAAVVLVFQL